MSAFGGRADDAPRLVQRSVTSNSSCICATMAIKASLAVFLSALPYLAPASSQFASRRDPGVFGRTTTPMNASQPGVAVLTASPIADWSSGRGIETRALKSFLGDFFGRAATGGGAAGGKATC